MMNAMKKSQNWTMSRMKKIDYPKEAYNFVFYLERKRMNNLTLEGQYLLIESCEILILL